jgi:hypothetical protein
MRALLPVAIAVTMSGCATHHARVQSQPDRPVSSDWAAVRALRAETYLLVALDGDRFGFGFLEDVTDTTVRIRGYPSTLTIPRTEVVRVEADLPIKRRHPRYGTLIASGFLGGLAGMVTGAIKKNERIGDWSAAVVSTSLIAGSAYYADHPPWQTQERRPVYVRP